LDYAAINYWTLTSFDLSFSGDVDVTGAFGVTGGITGGTITSNGSVIADTYFRSSDTALIMGTSAAGIIYIRPNGYGSATDQSMFSTSLATIGTDLSVTGTLASPAFARISNAGGTWVANQIIGSFDFHTTDPSGVGARELSGIKGVCTVGGAAGAHGLAFYTSIINTAATEKMRITDDGHVGIARDSATHFLEIGHGVNAKAGSIGLWNSNRGNDTDSDNKLEWLVDASGGYARGIAAAINVKQYNPSGHHSLDFRVGIWNNNNDAGNPIMTITSQGRVGINDETPNYTFDVSGTGRFTGDLRSNGEITAFA